MDTPEPSILEVFEIAWNAGAMPSFSDGMAFHSVKPGSGWAPLGYGDASGSIVCHGST